MDGVKHLISCDANDALVKFIGLCYEIWMESWENMQLCISNMIIVTAV